MSNLISDNEYQSFLAAAKDQYKRAQLKAAYAVNSEMIEFYWQLGKEILDKQSVAKWGNGLLPQLSKDMQAEFPATKGFSLRNLQYMKKFAEAYPSIVQQAVAQLPWGHIVILIERVKDITARDWYAQNAVINGVSRNILMMQIKQDLYERQGKNEHKVTNFQQKLPSPQSDLALQLFKDPYDFRFLPITKDAEEQEIERAMVSHLSKLFLELGTGFAYMGNQYKLTVDGRDFFLDMLFWHTQLSCYFVLELKSGELKPEHVGKLNFYLAAVDEILKKPNDNPTIGLLLCQEKSRLIAEYALKRTDGPIGVADYKLLEKLPKNLLDKLPSTEVLKFELQKIDLDEIGNSK